jgi:hypothetical protein
MQDRATYAGHRRIIDADSHVIELDDFLSQAASEPDLALLRPMNEQTELPVVQAGLDRGRELFTRRQSDPDTMAKFEEALLDNSKSGWNRIGAFDAPERSHTLDLFGFEMQWVLPTFSFHWGENPQPGNGAVLRTGSSSEGHRLPAHDPRPTTIAHPDGAGAQGRLLLVHGGHQRTGSPEELVHPPRFRRCVGGLRPQRPTLRLSRGGERPL